MRRSDFRYPLPSELIAQQPAPQRTGSRLLHLDGASGVISDRRFVDLAELLREGDLLVLNDTRVIPARVHGHKATGGRVEILLERVLEGHRVLAHLRGAKRIRTGAEISLPGGALAKVLARNDDLWTLELDVEALGYFERYGSMPLPPYIPRPAGPKDVQRYQTVYARQPGAVAAPTAGLHFDTAMLRRCRERGVATATVTLHVGAGTFQPVRAEDLTRHRMHCEWLSVTASVCDSVAAARSAGGRVIAVGTTVVRGLETAAAQGGLCPYEGETRLFILPGYRFRVVDALLTNFHLPESTLLMLVCAFGGFEQVMHAYRHAVAERYRFFSYGDAMFVEPDPTALAERGRPA